MLSSVNNTLFILVGVWSEELPTLDSWVSLIGVDIILTIPISTVTHFHSATDKFKYKSRREYMSNSEAMAIGWIRLARVRRVCPSRPSRRLPATRLID
jgi:hypothetical protein